jgi:hypothetical protein
MAANLNKPVNTDLFAQILTDIRDMQAALAKMDHSSTDNVPTNTVQWSETNKRLEKWNGTGWVALQPDATTVQKGLALLSTNSNSTATNLSATPSAVKAVRDLVTGLSLPAITGVATDAQIGNIAAISGHLRAGKTQLPVNITAQSIFEATTALASGAVESVGPTGSGADNIWTALDLLPASATVLKIEVYGFITGSSSSITGGLYMNATWADNADANESQYRVYFVGVQGSAVGEVNATTSYIEIPLNSANAFNMYWASTFASSQILHLKYKGFITD